MPIARPIPVVRGLLRLKPIAWLAALTVALVGCGHKSPPQQASALPAPPRFTDVAPESPADKASEAALVGVWKGSPSDIPADLAGTIYDEYRPDGTVSETLVSHDGAHAARFDAIYTIRGNQLIARFTGPHGQLGYQHGGPFTVSGSTLTTGGFSQMRQPPGTVVPAAPPANDATFSGSGRIGPMTVIRADQQPQQPTAAPPVGYSYPKYAAPQPAQQQPQPAPPYYAAPQPTAQTPPPAYQTPVSPQPTQPMTPTQSRQQEPAPPAAAPQEQPAAPTSDQASPAPSSTGATH